MKPCRMCYNARLDDELTDDNDYSAISIGSGVDGYRMMLCSGWGNPLRIEVEKWDEKAGWYKVASYNPKFCPNCGREIIEYNQKLGKPNSVSEGTVQADRWKKDFVEGLIWYLSNQRYSEVDETSTEMTEEYEKEHAWQLSRNCFINEIVKSIKEATGMGGVV